MNVKIPFEQLEQLVPTHSYMKYKGIVVPNDDGDVTKIQFIALWGARGKLRQPHTIMIDQVVPMNNSNNIGSDTTTNNNNNNNMTVGVGTPKSEPKTYDEKTWSCPKCSTPNKNDGSRCNALKEDGERCGTYRATPTKPDGWGGCFKNVPHFQAPVSTTYTGGIYKAAGATGGVSQVPKPRIVSSGASVGVATIQLGAAATQKLSGVPKPSGGKSDNKRIVRTTRTTRSAKNGASTFDLSAMGNALP